MKKILCILGLWLSVAWVIPAQAQSVSFTLTQVPCNNDGVLTANFTGLTPPIDVTWYVNGVAIVHPGINGLTDDLNPYSGAYVTVIGQGANNGPVADGSYAAPPFSYQVSTTDAVCPGLGSASVAITGGTAPYTYVWTDFNNNVVGTTNPVSLPGGAYQLMVTDDNGCTFGSAYEADSIMVNTEAGFDFVISSTDANCTDGTATVGTITGSGVAPYSYLWNTGASTTGITNLSQGAFNLTVTDAQGCSRTRTTYVDQGVYIAVNTTVTPATCTQADGAVMVFATGGTSPYTYLHTNGATTQQQTNMSTGYYSVAVTDGIGCTGTGYYNILASTPINVTFSTTPSDCTAPTGSATLSVSGGQAPYTIVWNTAPVQTGLTATNLAPGNYGFTVTDANGCLQTGVVAVPPQNIITASLVSTSANCTVADGSITATASGGAVPYTYQWNNGATVAINNNLAAGFYSVTITDDDGCSIFKSKEVYSNSPINLGLSSVDASCVFESDGTMTANVSGGTAPYTYAWSNGQSTATATGLAAGNYNVHVSDATGCTAYQFSGIGYDESNTSCYCTISGVVYYDQNANCVQDAGEAGIPNMQIHCSGIGYVYTNASGQYSFMVPSGTYTISQSIQMLYPLAACQSNAIEVSTTAGAGCIQTVDFANDINPLHDVHISTWNMTCAVPGNTYIQKVIVSNQGTIAESGAIASYQSDGQLNAATFIPGGAFVNSTPNWYEAAALPALAPGMSQPYQVHYNVPTNIPMSTQVHFRDSTSYMAPMSNWLLDNSPWNNVHQHQTSILSSYDPNFKQVIPEGEGPEGNIEVTDSVMEYMVHFQNLGTYYAQNIVVIDTLDEDLDWTTLKPMYASHHGTLSIDEHGVLTYRFPNIQLPTKDMNELLSQGMFSYTIAHKSDLALGTQIKNKAAIYFDYNDPVITNEVLNTLYDPSGIEEAMANPLHDMAIYPNPASDALLVLADVAKATSGQIQITDISGRQLYRQTQQLQAGKNKIVLSVAMLPSGVYLVQLTAGGFDQTRKVIVVK